MTNMDEDDLSLGQSTFTDLAQLVTPGQKHCNHGLSAHV